ncbi:uncharacterized protein BYT42DRAFT_63165 [Radiomyces spectabilis]|uniref:uncharacterized protein n=1 Tax=Radiomyces spectabilis TaxID=64574 RepID=UPI00221EBCEF|nr:uncharacterized protein BYT42DRAFT_63165 [Radiomyces spectabilis]KAI8373237.1 hypothetical protein BYT42DRAFT_63165 [Radiomyces spectabilis]
MRSLPLSFSFRNTLFSFASFFFPYLNHTFHFAHFMLNQTSLQGLSQTAYQFKKGRTNPVFSDRRPDKAPYTASAKKVNENIKDYKTTGAEETAVKIYSHIINQHAFHGSMLLGDYLNLCSEQSLIVKFWGYLFFEAFMSRNGDGFLQWCDPISESCKSNQTQCKMDTIQALQSVGILDAALTREHLLRRLCGANRLLVMVEKA